MDYHQQSKNFNPLPNLDMSSSSFPSLRSIIRPISHDSSTPLGGDESVNHNDSFGWSDFLIPRGIISTTPKQQEPHNPIDSLSKCLFGKMDSIQLHPPRFARPLNHGDDDEDGFQVSFGWGDFPVLAHSASTKSIENALDTKEENHVPSTAMQQ
jgi:hypothetical protein